MSFTSDFKFSALVLAGLFYAVFLSAQDKPDAEKEYERIRSEALAGDHEGARLQARKLVNSFPAYGDARILLARITAWQKNYNEAGEILDTLLQTDPSNSDALALKADIEKWSASPATAPASSKTDIAGGYSFDRFKEPYPLFWQIIKTGVTHKFIWGSGTAFLNTGLISAGDPAIHTTELQLEAEAFPRISAKNYAWLSYAFSNGHHFPSHRAAAEIWQVLPAGFAVSAGLNYFHFDRDIFIASASAEKYLGKYWISFKTYFFFKDAGITTSEYLNLRRYFNDSDYLQLTAGMGTAPDEPFDIQAGLYRLNASSIRLSYFMKLRNAMTIRIGAGYSREEFAESLLRNRFEGNLMLTYPLGRK